MPFSIILYTYILNLSTAILQNLWFNDFWMSKLWTNLIIHNFIQIRPILQTYELFIVDIILETFSLFNIFIVIWRNASKFSSKLSFLALLSIFTKNHILYSVQLVFYALMVSFMIHNIFGRKPFTYINEIVTLLGFVTIFFDFTPIPFRPLCISFPTS